MTNIRLPEQNRLPWQEIEARAGVAIGDALGATTEFIPPMEIRVKYGTLKKNRRRGHRRYGNVPVYCQGHAGCRRMGSGRHCTKNCGLDEEPAGR